MSAIAAAIAEGEHKKYLKEKNRKLKILMTKIGATRTLGIGWCRRTKHIVSLQIFLILDQQEIATIEAYTGAKPWMDAHFESNRDFDYTSVVAEFHQPFALAFVEDCVKYQDSYGRRRHESVHLVNYVLKELHQRGVMSDDKWKEFEDRNPDLKSTIYLDALGNLLKPNEHGRVLQRDMVKIGATVAGGLFGGPIGAGLLGGLATVVTDADFITWEKSDGSSGFIFSNLPQ